MMALVDRVVLLEGENPELTRELERLGETQPARSRAAGHPDPRAVQQRLSRARISAAAEERRRVARDLHDGVQNELVSLIVGLALAEQHPDTPPAVAAKLSVLGARAEATLDAIREIARGIHPPLLAAAGVI
jgi:signal transduction histidine kinase